MSFYVPGPIRVAVMPAKVLDFEADAAAAGKTLAAGLHRLGEIPHSLAKGLVSRGLVKVNGRVVREPAQRLSAGDRVETTFDPQTRYPEEKKSRARLIGFRVILEDDDFVVVEKDAGVLTVPAPNRTDDTLIDRLLAMYARRGFKSPKLWVVHRIDRFTSGLVLFARTEDAAAALVDQFERRHPRREYLAICVGAPTPAEGKLESWLTENPQSLRVSETRDHRKGQRAVLAYRIEERLTGATLLRVTLETGRRNQIRVQMAGVGHPLVGDRTYGTPSPLITRVALHAARLGFLHPRTLRQVRVETPLPDDMRRLLRRLRK